MWRVRQKELELDDRLKVRLRDDSSSDRSNRDRSSSKRSTNKRHIGIETSASVPCSSSKRAIQDCYSSEDEGLKDEDIDEFLHSRSAGLSVSLHTHTHTHPSLSLSFSCFGFGLPCLYGACMFTWTCALFCFLDKLCETH